ncbi:MAG: helix-turn-helix transcriptional regulator [Phycisphaeraceae bacterium]|nr:helix-turn-helix transcriptional regulator [Phycisphaeraceae bacterium]
MTDYKVPDEFIPRDYDALENRRRAMNIAIGERIRLLMHRQTLRGFGAEMGFHAQSIRRWMQGESSPPAAFLIAVCERYGVSADWLLLGTGPGGPDPHRGSPSVRVVDAMLIEKMAKLGEQLRALADEVDQRAGFQSQQPDEDEIDRAIRGG